MSTQEYQALSRRVMEEIWSQGNMNGKIVEVWNIGDALSMLQQVSAIPAPAEA